MNRPRPVLTAAGVAGAVTSIAGIIAFLGYSDVATHLTAEAQGLGSAVIAALGFGSHLLAALHAQGKVTPGADPRADDGTKLVPASSPATAMTMTLNGQHYLPAHAAPVTDEVSAAAALADADRVYPASPDAP